MDPNYIIHKILYIDQAFHDSFIKITSSWKLKLSAVLIYSVMVPLLKDEDKLIIDVDFDNTNQRFVIRYIRKLLSTYNRETRLEQCPIEFQNDQDPYVKVAHWISQKAKHRFPDYHPNLHIPQLIIHDRFEVLAKIR
jgi:hypothetical protein